ncbi:polysaccharide deacetylase family protein [Sphingopyxis sp. GC21]|jgi:predicted deacetylase|uniref:polysaccharide deacetylase family protein n=1 Tax=Sphingopyxis sp. GC21 TaxID=2933562 RepID=UPI0021E4C854|nr:polysaccharide deacetylase family protein [Sphingopyxis sp. GC21]
MTARRLLASIHDVTPVHAERLDRLVPIVEAAVGPGRYALLVVPDFHRQGLLTDDPKFARRLRGWADAGCEIFLHGFTHIDESRHAGAATRWKASRMTAGEGEFLGLSTREAEARIGEGRDMIEQVIGRPIDGFVAPAWLYGEDSLAALAAQDIRLIEDHFRVWNPQNFAVFARGPVVTYASRSRLRIASSILWSRLATTLLARASTVRLAVHPHDVDSPRLMREIIRALGAFTRSHQPAAYADLASGRFS